MLKTGRDRTFVVQIDCARSVPRVRAFTAGLLASGGQAPPRNCLIRDISPAGAQIRICALPPVPDGTYLINLGGRLAYHARAVWQQGSLAGLRFNKSFVINKMLPDELDFLRTLTIAGRLALADRMIGDGINAAVAFQKSGAAQDI